MEGANNLRFTTKSSGKNNKLDYKIVVEFEGKSFDAALKILPAIPSSCSYSSCLIVRIYLIHIFL